MTKRWLALLLLWVGVSSVRAEPSPATIASLQQSIVRVRSGGLIGTGFLWRKRNWVVTTMHLIGNKERIDVQFAGGVRIAHVVRTLREHDLVLLQLEQAVPASQPVLLATNGAPPLHASLYTLGYNGNGNQNTLIDRSLRLGFASNSELEGLLPEAVKNTLAVCKMPNPAIEVLYLDGALLPGFSGAPLVDDAGRLVGIADGGLEKGATDISWGIKAAQLPVLEASQEAFPASIACSGSAVRFAAEAPLEEATLTTVRVGAFTFVKTKTRTIAQMMPTVDDPGGLNWLLQVYANNNSFDYLNFNYDIYEELQSGAVVCVPSGNALEVHYGMLGIAYPTQQMAFMAQLAPAATSANPGQRYLPEALAYLDSIKARDLARHGTPFSHEFDAKNSYNQPIYRPDGSMSNRISFTGLRTSPNGLGQTTKMPLTFSLQTLAGRGDFFLGVSALNDEATVDYFTRLNACVLSNQCRTAAPTGDCAAICARLELFAKLVLGVHMAGFSNQQLTAQH